MPSWVDYADRYAAVMPQEGTETLAAKQVYPTLTLLLETRWVAGIRPKMRVQLGTRVLDILGIVHEDERNRVMRLACLERNV